MENRENKLLGRIYYKNILFALQKCFKYINMSMEDRENKLLGRIYYKNILSGTILLLIFKYEYGK